MKNELENIDQLFKNAFENYEANVDASVWNNIQQSIGSSAASTGSAATTAVSKSILLKIAAAIVVSSVVISTFVLVYVKEEKNEATIKNQVANKNENTITSTPNLIENEPLILDDNNITNDNKKELKEVDNKPETKVNQQKETTYSDSKTTSSPKVIATSPKNSDENNPKSSLENEAKIATNTKPTSPTPTSSSSDDAVEEDLQLTVKASITKGKAPLYVEFLAEGNAAKYEWNFNDGSKTSTQKNSYHTFTESGTYEVVLEAFNTKNNSKKIVTTIEVIAEFESSLAPIPTIFTPNGDGKHDVLKIEGENIANFQAVVMQQNGKVIFEWKEINGFWDGRDMANNPLPEGYYVVSGTATGIDGKQHIIKQIISLRK